MLSRFSSVQLCATPWTTACQAPLSIGFSRQEYPTFKYLTLGIRSQHTNVEGQKHSAYIILPLPTPQFILSQHP